MNHDMLYDFCEQYIHFYYVAEELADIGIEVPEIQKEINYAIKGIKEAIQ